VEDYLKGLKSWNWCRCRGKWQVGTYEGRLYDLGVIHRDIKGNSLGGGNIEMRDIGMRML